MANLRTYILVLWGKNFDEAATSLFVTELRQSGLRVKIVGLDGSNSVGANGIGLLSDLTLSDATALKEPVSCIIVPCEPYLWRRIGEDPRVSALIQRLERRGTKLVIGASSSALSNKPEPIAEQLPFNCQAPVRYPESERLLLFVRTLAQELSTESLQMQS